MSNPRKDALPSRAVLHDRLADILEKQSRVSTTGLPGPEAKRFLGALQQEVEQAHVDLAERLKLDRLQALHDFSVVEAEALTKAQELERLVLERLGEAASAWQQRDAILEPLHGQRQLARAVKQDYMPSPSSGSWPVPERADSLPWTGAPAIAAYRDRLAAVIAKWMSVAVSPGGYSGCSYEQFRGRG